MSADPPSARAAPATIEQLAATPLVFYDAESADHDPIRRQLAERAQALGVRLRPRVEVELKDIALRLVAAGVGDTYLPSAYTRAPYFPAGLHTAPSARRSTTPSRRHPPRRAALPRRARAARGPGGAHAAVAAELDGGGRAGRPH